MSEQLTTCGVCGAREQAPNAECLGCGTMLYRESLCAPEPGPATEGLVEDFAIVAVVRDGRLGFRGPVESRKGAEARLFAENIPGSSVFTIRRVLAEHSERERHFEQAYERLAVAVADAGFAICSDGTITRVTDQRRDAAMRELFKQANEGAWFLDKLGGKESAAAIRNALQRAKEEL